jgi:hypothetical protein
LLRFVVLSSVCAGLVALLAPGAALAGGKVKHPRLHHALYELREARRELKTAAHDFGGHRVKALKATDAAIRQIELCLKAVGEGTEGLAYGPRVYKKYGDHPHIRHALGELREARTALQNAPRDFKGHRKDAIRAVDRAIEQLQLALKFARR